jgi:hypothetical protein
MKDVTTKAEQKNILEFFLSLMNDEEDKKLISFLYKEKDYQAIIEKLLNIKERKKND